MDAALLEEQVLFVGTIGDDVLSQWSISKSSAQNHVTRWPTCAGALEHLLMLDDVLPELIVIECSLPMSTVVDFLTKLRNDVRTERVPVVILFDCDKELELTECYLLGAIGWAANLHDSVEYSDTLSWTTYYWLTLSKSRCQARPLGRPVGNLGDGSAVRRPEEPPPRFYLH